MNRCLAFFLALVLATITVSSACVAASSDNVRFTLEPSRGGDGRIHASFREEGNLPHENNWSSSFAASELAGLDLAAFRAAGTRPGPARHRHLRDPLEPDGFHAGRPAGLA